MEQKEQLTHYRKVFKSDHLGSADLEEMIEEGKSLIVTIEYVKQEYDVVVAGKKGNFNIAYFTDKTIKPLVLNAINSKQVRKFANGSPFVELWKNIPIELFVDSTVKLKGEIVGGVRIKPQQPTIKKPVLNEKHSRWEEIKERVKAGVTLNQIRNHYEISDADFKKLQTA